MKAQDLLDQPLIGARSGEVVESTICLADHVPSNERGAFGRALLGMLQAALPFKYCPALIVVLGEPGENRAEVDLSIARGTKAPRPVHPGRIGAVDSGAAAGTELGVLYVERLDTLVVDVNEGEIIELLKHEM